MTPAPEELRGPVAYRFSDFYRASLHVFLRTPIIWIAPTIFLLFLLEIFFNRDGPEGETAWWQIVAPIFLVLVWLFGIPWLQAYKTLRAPYMKHGLTYVFAAEGVA